MSITYAQIARLVKLVLVVWLSTKADRDIGSTVRAVESAAKLVGVE